MMRRPPRLTLFPYTSLSRSRLEVGERVARRPDQPVAHDLADRREGRDGGLHPLRQALELTEPVQHLLQGLVVGVVEVELDPEDRKSTRLNSSHANISYAVFC